MVFNGLVVYIIYRVLKKIRLGSIYRRIARSRIGFVFMFFTFMWLFNAFLFYYSEHVVAGRSDVDLWTSLYWSLITMATIGYGDVTPVRGLGWLVAGFTAVMGIIAYTLTISVIADSFLSASIRKALGQAPLKKKKIIVIGDSESCRELIDELIANGYGDETGWLTPVQPRSTPPVDYIVGDPESSDDLLKAGVAKADHILLCLSEDSKTVHVALMARKLNKKARLAAIVSSSHTEELLEEIGVEHILSNKLLGRAIASSVFEPSVIAFLREVVTAKGYSDLVEVKPSPSQVGKTIREVEEELSRKGKQRILAIYCNGELEILPDPTKKITENCSLVILKTKK